MDLLARLDLATWGTVPASGHHLVVAHNVRLQIDYDVLIYLLIIYVQRCRHTGRYESAMAQVPITVMGYRCERCDHEWIPRSRKREPRVCPKCKSPYWDRPRTTATAYEHFRRRVQDALLDVRGGLTWTEIRTRKRLPQKLPNNQWVRRLEREIGLVREREHGVMVWRLIGRGEE
ncbi:MAG: hypothetical protein F4Y98_01885 [Chloroflexi bacterium]|nr:hypothetical protein [Chloroflexota bacterium]